MHQSHGAQIVLLLVLTSTGCGEGWQMDYGQVAAQFNEDAVLKKAKPFLGQKITVKGIVTRQDLSDLDNCKIYLGNSICCNLRSFKAMAEGYTIGKTVFIDGILRRCEPGEILLDPAVGRDPQAEFEPLP
jgi:hypothetical protein